MTPTHPDPSNPPPWDGQPEERDFPTEAEWLSLPCPDAPADFVDRTLAAVLAQRDGVEDPPGWRELLAHYAPPDPAPGLVDRTLQRLARERSPEWQRLLARYASPLPNPQFVDRVVAALRADRARRQAPPARSAVLGRGAWPRWSRYAAAAAVVLALGVGWLSSRPAPRALPEVEGPLLAAASDFAPDRFGAAMASLATRGRRVAQPDPLLAHAAALLESGG